MEKWLPVKFYEQMYEISNKGNVRSLSRKVRLTNNKRRFYKGRTLRQKTCGGYKMVALYKYGTRKDVYVHRLVAEAFIPHDQYKNVVNHIDGVPSNNEVDNLEWVTHSENTQHAYDNGLFRKKGKCNEVNIELTIEENEDNTTSKKSNTKIIQYFNNDK